MLFLGDPLMPEIRVSVYELSLGEAAPFVRTGDFVEVSVKFTTNEGRVFAFLDSHIAEG